MGDEWWVNKYGLPSLSVTFPVIRKTVPTGWEFLTEVEHDVKNDVLTR